jgi:hypothetical protein
MKKLLLSFLLLVTIPTVSQAIMAPTEREMIKQYTLKYSRVFNTNPSIPLAVMHIESRSKDGSQEFRIGPIGKRGTYFGPGGIHKCFLTERGWPIHTLEGNVMVTCRAFQGIQTDQRLIERLRGSKYQKGYNASYTRGYGDEVLAAKRKYSNELNYDQAAFKNRP